MVKRRQKCVFSPRFSVSLVILDVSMIQIELFWFHLLKQNGGGSFLFTINKYISEFSMQAEQRNEKSSVLRCRSGARV